MKKKLFIAWPAKFSSAALLTSMLFFNGLTDLAAQAPTDTDNKAQITYVGYANNLMTFNVNFSNIESEKFVLELAGEYGEILYRNTFTGKSFNKNIYLKTPGDKYKVTFNLKAGKQSVNQQFEIAPQTKVVQETVVTKL